MAKKGKKNKSKKETKEEIVETTPPTSYSSEEMDDFDRLLQEFIASELSETEESSSSESDDDKSATSDGDNALSSPVVDCPQFAKIVNTLLDYDWATDMKAIDKNILHFSKDDKRFILYLYYGTKTANDWLADEEDFNGEEPLWFSENSHTISPVYEANKYADAINDKLEEYHQPIVVLTHPHHIVNADNILEQWDETLVVSIDRLCDLIESEANLEEVKTDAEDVGRNPDPNKSYESVENKFLKKALEEINRPQQTTETEEVEPPKEKIPNDGIDTDADDFKEIEIKSVEFAIVQNGDNGEDVLSSIATYFRPVTNAVFMIWVYIKGESLPDARYSFELRDDNDDLIVGDTASLIQNRANLTCLNLLSCPAGKYWFYIKHNGKQLFFEELIFVDLEKGYEKYIDLEAFGLFRIETSDSEDDHISIMKRDMQSCFNYDFLAGVLVTSIFKNISGKELIYEFILIIKNEQGKVIYEGEDNGTLDVDEQYVFASEVRGIICPTGNYTIIVKFLDEVVLVTDFTVGHRDVIATFKVDQLKVRSGKKSRANTTVEDPMKELNSMVGLDDLKVQLRKHISKIQMDQLRKSQLLPVKAQQLHMAFLGNPGTGKTTVAKLLGQIYKDIGVLSKGHVVLEDRSTLMTQNWGGEGELVNKALEKAQGGILFIDDVYNNPKRGQ